MDRVTRIGVSNKQEIREKLRRKPARQAIQLLYLLGSSPEDPALQMIGKALARGATVARIKKAPHCKALMLEVCIALHHPDHILVIPAKSARKYA